MTAPVQAQPAPTTREHGVRYAALALGILALITSVLLVGLLFGSLAVTLGLADLDAVTDEPTNRKSAIAAVVLGIVAIVIGLAALVFRIWLIV
jgi:hypothetical protein